MLAWAAIPNAFSARYWSLSRKTTNFWFDGLKTSLRNLGFDVAIGWNLTYFIQKTARSSLRSPRVRLLVFWNVCNASPLMRKWKWKILLCPVGCLWKLRLVWKRFEGFSVFPAFPSKMRMVVVSDFGRLGIKLRLLFEQSCKSSPTVETPKKSGRREKSQACFHYGVVTDMWSAHYFFSPEEVPGEPKSFHSWALVTITEVSSGLNSCEDWLKETLTSGWGSFREPSSLWAECVPFRKVTRTGWVSPSSWFQIKFV